MKSFKGATEDYFVWLLEHQLNWKHGWRRYEELLRYLFDTPFRFCMAKDKNRVGDGLYLRVRFMDNTGLDISDQNDCSVLEMLIALAIRMDAEYVGDPGNPDPLNLFLDFLDNLEILYINGLFHKEEVENKINLWMDRKYRYNGDGGIFPLGDPMQDQRDIEIWRQMYAYITEKFC